MAQHCINMADHAPILLKYGASVAQEPKLTTAE
jgi:hypothetical protein